MSLMKNIKTSLTKFEKTLTQLEGVYNEKKQQKREIKKRIFKLNKELDNYITSLTIAQIVAKQTQQQLEIEISNIVTSAIQAIFKKQYEFKIEFITKRNKTEAEIYLLDENDQKFFPQYDNGGGIVDVISFALRIACWRLNNPKTEPILLFDEPLKFVSKEYKEAVIEFIKEICDKLNMQIIMVTHDIGFIENADNIIEVK